MPLRAIIFDIDGTLVDSNEAHVEAWHTAFASLGHDVSRDRIRDEIGKGGDKLVPSILGEDADERDGDALRDRQSEAYLAIAGRERIAPFPRAREIFDAVRARGLRSALATSSSKDHLEALERSSGLELHSLGDELVNADDIAETKPAPDLVEAALGKLGVAPSGCAMVGDTPFDAEAARHAGVPCIGVTAGGNSAERLRAAGAFRVYRDIAEVEARLDELIEALESGPAR
ncbi:MAG TPA: HAD family hydrolase [Gemmatimonadales bacterium]